MMTDTANWKDKLRRQLTGQRAPRVLGATRLQQLANGSGVGPRAFANWLSASVVQGQLVHVRRGLYLNALATPAVTLDEAVHYMRAGAVISLGTVLDRAQVTRNQSGNEILALVPIHPGQSPANLGRAETALGPVRFHAMPTVVLNAGSVQDRLLRDRIPRATPEKALLDWLYLGRTGRSTVPALPLETNLSGLQQNRLQRLIQTMALTAEWNDYLRRKRAYDSIPIRVHTDIPRFS